MTFNTHRITGRQKTPKESSLRHHLTELRSRCINNAVGLIMCEFDEPSDTLKEAKTIADLVVYLDRREVLDYRAFDYRPARRYQIRQLVAELLDDDFLVQDPSGRFRRWRDPKELIEELAQEVQVQGMTSLKQQQLDFLRGRQQPALA